MQRILRAGVCSPRPKTHEQRRHQCERLAGRRGGSGGLPPTALSLARFCHRRAAAATEAAAIPCDLAPPPALSLARFCHRRAVAATEAAATPCDLIARFARSPDSLARPLLQQKSTAAAAVAAATPCDLRARSEQRQQRRQQRHLVILALARGWDTTRLTPPLRSLAALTGTSASTSSEASSARRAEKVRWKGGAQTGRSARSPPPPRASAEHSDIADSSGP
jgi:hypothetical protein